MKKLFVFIFFMLFSIRLFSNQNITCNEQKLRVVLLELITSDIYSTGLLIQKTLKNNMKYFKLEHLSKNAINTFLSKTQKRNNKISYCFISKNYKIFFHSYNYKVKSTILDFKFYNKVLKNLYQKALLRFNLYYEVIIPVCLNRAKKVFIHIGFKTGLIDEYLKKVIEK